MTVTNKALILDLIEWIADRPRPYADVMDAWRTSCPRLPIWEDAVDMGFVVRRYGDRSGPFVEITPAGQAFLRSERPSPARADSASAIHEFGQAGHALTPNL